MNPLKNTFRLLGLVMILGGLALAGWIAYNMFISETPQFRDAAGSTRSAGRAMIFGAVIAGAGLGLLARFGRSGKDQSAAPAGAPAVFDANLDPETFAEIRSAAQSGRTIEAVKRYREATGAGLAESKAAVEKMARKAA